MIYFLKRRYSFVLFIATMLACGSLSSLALGQTTAARPDRGTMPNGSYAVSDIENISLQNGNMNLSIPLASLPPIAGGKLSWTIKAQYNSKLWNITREEKDAPDFGYNPYVVDTPQLSELGGWRISSPYQVSVRNAHDDFDYLIPPSDSMQYSDYQLLVNYQWYKVVLQMPDGSEHELRPVDYSPYSGSQDFLKGYYNVSPDTTGTMRYYSFDGSYLYATVTSGNNWTVYLPDGTKVIQTSDGIQRVQDTNGNKIKIYSDTNGTHYQDEQTGREIRYSDNGTQGVVSYQTVTGVWMQILINFDFTHVQGQVYRVNDWLPSQINPRPCLRYNELNTEIQVIRGIVLPQTEPGVAQRQFSFAYNSDATESVTNNVNWTCQDAPQSYTRQASKGWGELNQITTPSGAVIQYAYGLDTFHLPFSTDDLAGQSITQKQLTHDGVTDSWSYSMGETTGSMTGPDGTTTTEYKYSHSPGFGFGFGKAGLSFRTVQPFRRIDRHWTDLAFSGAATASPNGDVSFNTVMDVEYTTLLDASGNQLKMSARAYQYDYNGNQTAETDYDWFDPTLVTRDANDVPTGVPASAVVLRVVNNTYYNGASSANSTNVYAKRSSGMPLILNALQQSVVGPAITQLSYDGQAYGTAPSVGNLTSQSVWDDTDNKWITSSQTYGSYGNLASKTDARGKVTQFYYDDATHAVPNRVVVDPQNGSGTQTVSTVFDYATGLVTSQTDPNGSISSIDYTNQLLGTVDPFGRPGLMTAPAIGLQSRRSRTYYADSLRMVTAVSDFNSQDDQLIKSQAISDMLGRTIESRQYETTSTYITVKHAYDSVNRTEKTSNPFRAGEQVLWTTVVSDPIGRVTSVTTPDSAAVSTSYSANTVTVTDQIGKQRKSVSDALGRLLQVYEDPNGLNYLTGYVYDVFGNLRTVNQDSQTRTFNYDSLSRLRSAVNPESGTILTAMTTTAA